MKRIASLAALALAACGPSVKSLTVEPPRAVLEAKGAVAVFKATPKDDKGRPVADGQVKPTWTSSAPLVASVDETGKVTALKSGEATITAAVGDVKGSAKVAVAIPATVTLVPASVELKGAGQTARLEAKVADDSGRALPGPKSVTWASSDPSIVKVADGQVTAVGAGSATVSASVGSVRGQAEVTVKVPDFARLVVKPVRVALGKAGASARIAVTALDRKGKHVAGVPVAWKSANEGVVKVASDGTVTAVKKGKAKVTASAGGRSAAVEVTVKK
jgi:uncharacterized protein YjdB